MIPSADARTRTLCPDEQQIASFVDGRLPELARQALEHHLDACEPCTALVAELADVDVSDATLPSEREDGSVLAPGSRLGRYVVGEQVGLGGMGVVYAGHDPELGRKVALKLVLPSRDHDAAARREAHARLLREAQALAKLDHPNVVAVYDVGSVGGRVFIAMAFVEGGTLSAWLRAQPRSWPEVLACFVGAARGLAAAHRAGLVHRDFKPGNVLLGTDGTPQVVDFGLVRPDRSRSFEGEEPITGRIATELDTVTRTGVVMGTPAYMAPEQIRGEPADARADQFSFCVALWEAAYGCRPFEGRGIQEIHDAIASRRLAAARRNHHNGAPRWLRGVLLRGLAPRREDRFPDMEALARVLQRDPGRALRRGLGIAGLLGATVLAAWLGAASQEPETPCDGGRARIEEVWSEAARGRVTSAFAATGLGFADDAAARVLERLDARTSGWARMHDEACLAHRHGLQSAQLLDRRMACLDRRRLELRALVERLGEADASVVRRAEGAVAELASLERCADLSALQAEPSLPDDPERRAEAFRIADVLARAEVLEALGDYEGSLDAVRGAVESARALAHDPLLAEALAQHGLVASVARTGAEAEPLLVEATQVAARAAHDEVGAFAWIELLWVMGSMQSRHAEALALARAADAAVIRAGDPEALRGRYLDRLGIVQLEAGRYADARTSFERAVEIRERALGPAHPEVAISLSNLGHSLHRLGELDRARQVFERAVEIETQALHPRHPNVAGSYEGIGIVLQEQGKPEESLEYLQRALEIREERLAPDHAMVIQGRINVAAMYIVLRRYDEALSPLQRLLGDHEAGVAVLDDEGLAHVHATLGAAHYMREDLVAAEEHLRRGIELGERLVGRDHPELADRLANLAAVDEDLGRWPEAAALYERTIAIRRQARGEDHPSVARAQKGLGIAYLRLGRVGEGVALLEQATRRLESEPSERWPLASGRFELARALWGLGQRARAVATAQSAREAFREHAHPNDAWLAELDAWLAEHR